MRSYELTGRNGWREGRKEDRVVRALKIYPQTMMANPIWRFFCAIHWTDDRSVREERDGVRDEGSVVCQDETC